MKQLNRTFIFLFLASTFFVASCTDTSVDPDDFGIFSSQDENTAIMNGEIGTNTPAHWDNFIAAFPNVNKIIMKDCPGSGDDDANLEAARKVRTQNVTIHLPADAEIASGAVDFYLAGTTRTRETGSQIGVHSWGEGSSSATDYAVGHEKHQPYIDYYVEMGFSQADSEAFYYFTINAAGANDIHWMTEDEIDQYKLVTP